VNCELLTTTAPVRAVRKAARTIPVHISGTTIPDCFCSLVGIEAGILYVRSDRQMSESSPIVVSFDHVQLSGVVAGCQPDEDAWMISVALASCKRRLEERIPHGEESAIGVVERGQTTMRQCTIVDTSSFGMGLRLAFPIDTGSRVCIETNASMVFGEIRYCRPGADGQFIAGVLIVDVVPDVRTQNQFSVMLNNLRWKLASSIRGRDVPAYRADR
jgi:hypothetical protein